MGVDRLALRDGHRAEGPPVVCALHRDDVLLARDATSHLERGLDRFRTRSCEEERVERRMRHDEEQTVNEAQIRLVVRDTTLTTAQDRRGGSRGGMRPTCPCTRLRHWSAAALLTLGWQ